jgi:hypothetical protein
MKSKIRGYEYQIVELYPCVSGDEGFRHVSIHDRLEDATKVLEVLESVNYNFTCYGLMMRPVWDKGCSIKDGWDANGSPVTEENPF